MVTIAHLTKKILQDKPFIHEALERDLINIVSLSEYILPDIEREIGKVKVSAISMAIRRYIENSRKEFRRIDLTKGSEILIKSNLFEVSLQKDQSIFKKLMKLYEVVDFTIGDTLNIIHGNYEILIVSNSKYKKKILDILKDEKIKSIQDNIASLSLKIPKECIDTPGFYYSITKIFAFENISIKDIVNTETEATFILDDKVVSKAYDVLKREISINYYQKN